MVYHVWLLLTIIFNYGWPCLTVIWLNCGSPCLVHPWLTMVWPCLIWFTIVECGLTMVIFGWRHLVWPLDTNFDVCHSVTYPLMNISRCDMNFDEHCTCNIHQSSHHIVMFMNGYVILWHTSKSTSHCDIHQWLCHIVTFIKVLVALQQPSMVMLYHLWLWLTMIYYI